MTAVLRVFGDHLDVDQCRAWLPADRLDAVWRAGEKGYLGKVATTSGFNLLLSDSEDREQLVRETVTTFLTVADRVAELIKGGATGEIDFALFFDIDKALALVGEGGPVEVQGTKTENGMRPVPLHRFLTDALAWWREVGWAQWVGRKPRDRDLLFPNGDGEPCRPRSADNIRDDLALAGLAGTYGPKKHNIVFHALRATFSTWLEEADVSDSVRARLMGQGGVSTADNWYTSKELARLQKGIEALSLSVTVEDLTTYEPPPRAPRSERSKSDENRAVS